MKRKRAIVHEIETREEESEVLSGVVLGGCLECGADVPYARAAPIGQSLPIDCPVCGFEIEFRRIAKGQAVTRRPYGCSRYVAVESSNLAAVGVHGEFLLIKFKKGNVYRYAGAAGEFDDLIASSSAGKFFHARIRSRPFEKVCVVYGCFESSGGAQLLCQMHLDRGKDRSSK